MHSFLSMISNWCVGTAVYCLQWRRPLCDGYQLLIICLLVKDRTIQLWVPQPWKTTGSHFYPPYMWSYLLSQTNWIWHSSISRGREVFAVNTFPVSRVFLDGIPLHTLPLWHRATKVGNLTRLGDRLPHLPRDLQGIAQLLWKCCSTVSRLQCLTHETVHLTELKSWFKSLRCTEKIMLQFWSQTCCAFV